MSSIYITSQPHTASSACIIPGLYNCGIHVKGYDAIGYTYTYVVPTESDSIDSSYLPSLVYTVMFAMYLWFQCAVLLAVGVSCIVMASPLVEQSSLQQSVGGIIRLMKKSPRHGYDGPTVNEKSFDDIAIAYFNSTGATVVGVCSIDICFGDSVDFMQVTLCRQAPRHGSDSCQPQLHTIAL